MMRSRYAKREFKEPQQEQYRHSPSKHKEDITWHGDQKQSPGAVVIQEQKHQNKSQPNPLPKHLPLEAINGKNAGHASATRECATSRSPTANGNCKARAVLRPHWQPTNNNLLPLQHNDHHEGRHHNCGQDGSLVRVRDGDCSSHDEPEQASRVILYKQRSTKSLLADDDDEEASVRDRFLQGIPVPPHNNRNDDKFANVINTHPDLQSVLEVFPDANPGRVLHLLRQKSLTTTLLLLADESSDANFIATCRPSDELLLPPELNHATTYAQANDEHRAIIMTYLTDMFPEIPRIEIESLLMGHSTQQTVSILAEWSPGEVLKPPVPTAAAVITAPCMAMKHAPPIPSRRTSDPPHPALLKRRPLRSPIDDDDDDAWRPSRHRTQQ